MTRRQLDPVRTYRATYWNRAGQRIAVGTFEAATQGRASRLAHAARPPATALWLVERDRRSA